MNLLQFYCKKLIKWSHEARLSYLFLVVDPVLVHEHKEDKT